MSLSAELLSRLIRLWPDPTRHRTRRFGAAPASDEYNRKYAEEQFLNGVWFGTPLEREMPPLWGKRVLEIGCGHGGISCYLASLGAAMVVGADLGTEHVRFGRELSARLDAQRGAGRLPLHFAVADAHRLGFREGSFDVVIADNVFEHFADPRTAMQELFRVLTPGGALVIPVFSSIRSKWGLHLKHGIKLPWTNLVFTEDTIVQALKSEAKRRPELLEFYPGLRGDPQTVRDVRRHRDLNAITHAEFTRMAEETGFSVEAFKVHATAMGRIVRRLIPNSEQSNLLEVLSTGAGAVLRRPESSP